MSERSTKPDPYIAWRNHDFRYYAISWFLVSFSKRVEILAIAVFFVNLFGSEDAPLALGLIGGVQALPIFVLAIAGGQIADRYDRRLIWILMCSINLVASIGMVLLTLWDVHVVWFYAILGMMAVGTAIGSPSRAALLPQLVPKEIFTNAVTWNSTVFFLASVTGPPIGGLIMASWNNPVSAFVLVAVCRLGAVVSLAAIRHRHAAVVKQDITWKNTMAGIQFVWNTKLILATITLDLFAVLLGGITYLLPIYATDILKVGPAGLGWLQAAEAIGAIAMAVLLAHLPPMKHAGLTLLWAVAGFGIATIVFGVSHWFWLSLLMMFTIGALDNISVVVRHTLVQMLTPDEMRGRVSAVNNIFIVASNDLGGLESGLTAWLFGPVLSVIGGGIGTLLVVLSVGRIWPQILSIGSLSSIQPMPLPDSEEESDLVPESA